MKLIGKVLLALCVLALAAPFVLKGPDGRPLLQVDDLQAPDISLPNLGGDAHGSAVPAAGDAAPQPAAARTEGLRMYRWRDNDGTVHFANDVPDGVQAEVIVVRDNITRLAADWVPEAAPAAVAQTPDIGNPFTAYRNADKVLEQAHDAARLMERHNANIDAAARQR